MTSPTMAAGHGRPTDIPAYIADKLKHQTPERVVRVGEQTGWWTADDVDWAMQGGEGVRPVGWSLEVNVPAEDGSPTLALADWERALIDPSLTPAQLDEHLADITAASARRVAADAEELARITVDVGEPVAPSSYVGAVSVADVFADSSYQRPLQDARARAMAKAWNPRMVAVIDVSDRGEGSVGRRYAVVNGQHRWRAAQMAGVEQLAATIHEGLDVTAEAALMYELDRGTKPLSSWDKWRARRAAGDEHVLQVEAVATQHGMTCDPRSFGAVGAAETVVRRDGRQALATAVLILTEAWGTTAAAVKAPALLGMATVLRQPGQLDAQRLVEALRGTTPQQVRARADALREVDGGSLHALTARAMVTAYNGRPGPKLTLS